MVRDRDLLICGGAIASAGWLLHAPLYEVNPWAFAAVSAAAVAWLITRLPAGSAPAVTPAAAAAAGAGCLTLCAAAGPVGLAWPAALGTAVALGGLASRRPRVAAAATAWLLVAALSAAVEGAYSVALWFTCDSNVLQPLFAPLVALVTPATYYPEGLRLFDGRSTYGFRLGLEATHAVWAVRFVAAGVLLTALFAPRRLGAAAVARLALAGLAVTTLWVGVSSALWDVSKHPRVFLHLWTSFAVELLGLALLWPFAGGPEPAPGSGTEPAGALGFGRWSWARGAAAAATAAVVVFCLWYPAGSVKPVTRVLVDDSHSKWESSDLPFDFTPKGLERLSSYSYTSFVDLIGRYYEVELNKDKPIDQFDLSRFGVVLLKTPSKPFSEGEVKAIRRFVAQGGGLFVHGDHTNLFGMSTYLNELLADAGVTFNADDQATFDGAASRFVPDHGAFRHVTLRGVKDFQFLTSCTLRPTTPLVEPVIASPRIFSENARYFRPGFFGDMAYEPSDRLGTFLQAAVVPYGRGRIAVFCDSTVFSNFACFQSGYADYALATLDYLQRAAPWSRRLLLFAAAGLVLAAAAGLAVRLRGVGLAASVRGLALDGSVGVAAGVAVAALLATRAPAAPAPARPQPTVAFLVGNGFFANSLMSDRLEPAQLAFEYSGFFMCWQRAGYRPRVCASVADLPKKADVIVLIAPNREFTRDETIDLVHRVHDGGSRLLVVDSLANHDSAANPLLHNFGAGFSTVFSRSSYTPSVTALDLRSTDGRVVVPAAAAVDFLVRGGNLPLATDRPFPSAPVKLTPSGGLPLILDGDGDPVLSARPFGRGALFLTSDGAALSALRLGTASIMKPLGTAERANVVSVSRLIRLIESDHPSPSLLLDPAPAPTPSSAPVAKTGL